MSFLDEGRIDQTILRRVLPLQDPLLENIKAKYAMNNVDVKPFTGHMTAKPAMVLVDNKLCKKEVQKIVDKARKMEIEKTASIHLGISPLAGGALATVAIRF